VHIVIGLDARLVEEIAIVGPGLCRHRHLVLPIGMERALGGFEVAGLIKHTVRLKKSKDGDNFVLDNGRLVLQLRRGDIGWIIVFDSGPMRHGEICRVSHHEAVEEILLLVGHLSPEQKEVSIEWQESAERDPSLSPVQSSARGQK
jgi:hypothetical protein